MAQPASYSELLRESMTAAAGALQAQRIEGRYLQFGGPGEPPLKKIRIPTDAFSEFLANRAMGDWAERTLAAGIQAANPAWHVIPYGDADRLAAGEQGFAEFYLERSEAVRLYGKRPDLLIVPSTSNCPPDLSAIPYLDSEPFAREALAAIEVRSSKFEVFKYMAARAAGGRAGKTKVKETLSFTIKVEDLRVVYRWLERHPIPQLYCQVFFDAVFALSVLDILRIIAAEPKEYLIERDTANQMKTTIKIPVTSGRQIGVIEPPDFHAEHRVTRLGRHDAYVVPTGGRARIDPQALGEVIGLPRPSQPCVPFRQVATLRCVVGLRQEPWRRHQFRANSRKAARLFPNEQRAGPELECRANPWAQTSVGHRHRRVAEVSLAPAPPGC